MADIREPGPPGLRRSRQVLSPDVDAPAGRVFVEDCCANCLDPLPDGTPGLFCSPWCQETAKYVRYFRGVARDGRIQDPEVQYAIHTRLAFLLSGGYTALHRTLSPQTRQAVVRRDAGLCRLCGAPGTEIDHIQGSSGGMDNLQLLCRDCHRRKTAENMVPADAAQKALIGQLFEERVRPDTPRLLADDHSRWGSEWRALKQDRARRIAARVAARPEDPQQDR